jgi:hypothetical protein
MSLYAFWQGDIGIGQSKQIREKAVRLLEPNLHDGVAKGS